VVYRARDTRLDRSVAIKVPPATIAADQAARERFAHEARAVAALNHPHICTLYDIGEAPSPEATESMPVRFLVMEYVEGTTLDQVGPLPLDPPAGGRHRRASVRRARGRPRPRRRVPRHQAAEHRAHASRTGEGPSNGP